MKLTRRNALKTSAVLGAAAAVPLAASRAGAVSLVVHDSRLSASRAFLAAQGQGRRLDIAGEEDRFWASVRSGLPHLALVEGLTRWSDWVQLRGALEERGLRLVSETRLDRRSGADNLYRWTMRRRG